MPGKLPRILLEHHGPAMLTCVLYTSFLREKRMSRRRAFTLVELLVVIGVIAILISILLPALNKARESARMIDCSSRARTVMQAVFMYINDNRGAMAGATNSSSQIWPVQPLNVVYFYQPGTQNIEFEHG